MEMFLVHLKEHAPRHLVDTSAPVRIEPCMERTVTKVSVTGDCI